MINRVSLKLLEERKDLVGVELGLNLGYNAKNILENLDIKMLYCVDPYIPYENFTKEKVDRWKSIMYSEFKSRNDPNVTIIEMKSIHAEKQIPDELDFVYIDGGHDHQTVWSDINIYVNKIRKGGLLCGDNFECLTVRCAVYDFLVLGGNNLQLSGYGTNADTETFDWWIWI